MDAHESQHADGPDTPLDPDTGLPQEPATGGGDDTDPPEVPGDNDGGVPLPGDGLGDELRGDALAKPDFALDEPPRAADGADREGSTGDSEG